MDDDARALGWLGRKVAWGFAPGERDDWIAVGVDTAVDRLVDPDAHGINDRSDPYEAIIEAYERDDATRAVADGVIAWLDQALETPRPLETFMELFWLDYFAISVRSVRPPTLMLDHVRLLGRHALGNVRELLHDVTIDAAMLVFLDGASSTAGNPNENYGRELLELYSVGVGNFTEADVKAAATALTGWQVRRANPVPRFRQFRHDDTPQTLLGVDGVDDVESVIDAVVSNPATPARIVDLLATAVLGPDYDRKRTAPLVTSLADDLEIRPVVRALLEIGIDGGATPSVMEPLAWMTMARRFTGARVPQRILRTYFRSAGQVPLMPPDVGGYPDPDAYLSSSATIARFNLASELATRASSEALAATEDLDDLAWQFGLVDGFAESTRTALAGLEPGADRLAAALASPDLLVV